MFMPLESARCPAVDRRYQQRSGQPERRAKPRPCDRAFFVAGPGTIVRVRVAQSGEQMTTWVTPGGISTCWKCGVNLEVQVIPVVLLLPALRNDPRIVSLLKQFADPLPPLLSVASIPTPDASQLALPPPATG